MVRGRWRGRDFRRRRLPGRLSTRCVANVAERSMGRMGAISIRGGVRRARAARPERCCGRLRRDYSDRSGQTAEGFVGWEGGESGLNGRRQRRSPSATPPDEGEELATATATAGLCTPVSTEGSSGCPLSTAHPQGKSVVLWSRGQGWWGRGEASEGARGFERLRSLRV